jgi:hypothetical protein
MSFGGRWADSFIAIPLEFEIPVERFAIERNTVVGGAVGDIKCENGFESVIAGVDEANFAN